MRYPHVVNMADAGEIIAGSIGREVVGAGQLLFMVFIMGSHLLTFTVAMNSGKLGCRISSFYLSIDLSLSHKPRNVHHRFRRCWINRILHLQYPSNHDQDILVIPYL